MHSTHFTGAVSELTAAHFFLSRGMQVYQPMVQQGAADLVVQTPDGLKKVQVKTMSLIRCKSTAGNTHTFLQCRIVSSKSGGYKPGDWDILACVFNNSVVTFSWDAVKDKKSLSVMVANWPLKIVEEESKWKT